MKKFTEYLNEGDLLKKIMTHLRGYDKDELKKSIDKLDKNQLKSIVRTASPQSAHRVLLNKDYNIWKMAYDKLNNESEGS